MAHRNENSGGAALAQDNRESAQSSDRARPNEVQTQAALTTSTYSRFVKLHYFVSPNSSMILLESYSDVRARQREARYSRNLNDPNEREPYAHRTLIARYNSFFDNPARPSTSSLWARSLRLALLLAHLGFYFVPRSQQSPRHDKIRCSYCKRGKYGWFAWSYPETERSAAYRPSDTEIANALLRWHRIKSPTCPAILDLDVDGESASPAGIIVPTNNASSIEVPACLSTVADEEQTEEFFNVSETTWQHYTNAAVPFTPTISSYCTRITASFAIQPKFADFCSEDVRLWTFSRGSLVSSDEKYVTACLENTNLALGNDCWPQTAPSAQRMASAGFIATLRADEVYCYHCGGALTDWQVSDDPLAEHAFHFPSCPFILNNCGARFVERVRARASRTQYSPVLGPFEQGAVHRRVEPRDVRCRPEVCLERTIAEELKVDPLLYSHAIETALREEGDYKNALGLLDIVREQEALRRQSKLDVREFVRRRNEEYDQLLRGTHALLNQAPAQQEGGQHAEEPANGVATCAVCLENPLQLAFVPCGHLSTCFSCGSRLDTCPICRRQIRGVVRVYI